MNDDIYVQLCERLNKNFVKRPPVPSVLDFLREIFTEEQARLGAEMPLGAHTVQSLSRLLNRDEGPLEFMLEKMADQGLMFVSETDDHEKEYSLPPFLPGLTELQFMKGEDNERTRRVAHLTAKIEEDLHAFAAQLAPKLAEAPRKPERAALRTIAVERELPNDTEVADWEKISEILEKQDSFAVTACACRQEAKLEGRPCKIEGVPEEACIYFGKIADYLVDRNFGRRLDRDELIELLKTCEQHGLIHNVSNYRGDHIVLCNCCGCCCKALNVMFKFPGLLAIVNSNFHSVADAETCTGCGECVAICQVKAISLVDDTAIVDSSRCMGCANCVSVCPSGSLSMVRCADYEPPEKPKKIIGLGQ